MQDHKYYIHYTITNRSGSSIYLKNIKIAYGSYYQIYHEDNNKQWGDTVKIKNGNGFDLLCYAIPESKNNTKGPFHHNVSKVYKPPNMTKGSFDMYNFSNEKILHAGWECSKDIELNTFELYYINQYYVVQQTGGNHINGPIGKVHIIVACPPMLCNFV
jgi:hypothetical protein